MKKYTEHVIAVQDLRTSLAAIADRASTGESFLIMRNSRPAFRIVPATNSAERPASAAPASAFRELVARYQASGLSRAISRDDVEAMIREVHDVQRTGRTRTCLKIGTAHSAVATTLGVLPKSAVATPLCGVSADWGAILR